MKIETVMQEEIETVMPEKMETVTLGRMEMRVGVSDGVLTVAMKTKDVAELAGPTAGHRALVVQQMFYAAQENGWTHELKTMICSNFLVLWFMLEVLRSKESPIKPAVEDEWVWTNISLMEKGSLQ